MNYLAGCLFASLYCDWDNIRILCLPSSQRTYCSPLVIRDLQRHLKGKRCKKFVPVSIEYSCTLNAHVFSLDHIQYFHRIFCLTVNLRCFSLCSNHAFLALHPAVITDPMPSCCLCLPRSDRKQTHHQYWNNNESLMVFLGSKELVKEHNNSLGEREIQS